MRSPDAKLLGPGALLAGLGVALGAFGAPGLRDSLSPAARGWWQTAVDYQMWHAIALVALAAVDLPGRRLAAAMLGAGVLIFSGTLYARALTDARWLGAVTPLGGSLMILGWLALGVQALRRRDPADR